MPPPPIQPRTFGPCRASLLSVREMELRRTPNENEGQLLADSPSGGKVCCRHTIRLASSITPGYHAELPFPAGSCDASRAIGRRAERARGVGPYLGDARLARLQHRQI